MLRLLLAAALAASVPFVPNDPGFPAQRPQLDALSVPQAWSLTQGDPAVVIAIVDEGVAPDPDLALVPGNANVGVHGTAAALIAAAQINNGIGGAGICGRCLVMPSTDVDWAIGHGADVIAVTSCGAPPPQAALARAAAHGIRVFICPSEARAFDNAAYAGIAGLMLSCNPVLTPTEITQILISSSYKGVVNAYRAVVLAVCRARGWRTEGYHLPSHRMQRTNLRNVAAAARLDEDRIETAVDGCGVVTFALSLERMADMFTRLQDGPGGKSVADAMRAHPELIRGEGAPDTILMQTLSGAVAKGGAEGLLCGVLADGTGFAIKCADGAGRALGPGVAAFLARLDAELPRLYELPLTNRRGENVGTIALESNR